jgi:hypothetical protein
VRRNPPPPLQAESPSEEVGIESSKRIVVHAAKPAQILTLNHGEFVTPVRRWTSCRVVRLHAGTDRLFASMTFDCCFSGSDHTGRSASTTVTSLG